MRELVVGTRGSVLAMQQTRWIADRLSAGTPGQRIRIETIRTAGDVSARAPLWEIGGGGLFVKELERALLDGRIDIAVHSMKDLPSDTEPGLVVAAVPEREDPRDVLVSRHRVPVAALPTGARLGTSSSRRRAQLLAYRSDLEIVSLRGNLDTRLRKAEAEDLDGIVLAAAGLSRLGWLDRVTEFLPPEMCLPAVGQGALAVQTRDGVGELIRMLAGLEHPPSRSATEAERAFMKALGGGCQVPMAAWCRGNTGSLEMDALVAAPDGSRVIRARETGDGSDPIGLGERVAGQLMSRGAAELLGRSGRG